MSYLAICLTLWLILINLQTCYGTIVNNKVLRNHTIVGKKWQRTKDFLHKHEENWEQTITSCAHRATMVSNSYKCQKSCALTVDCIAMNLHPTDPPSDQLMCHLLDKDHYKRPYLLVDSKDSEYHVVSVSLNFFIACQGSFICLVIKIERCTLENIIMEHSMEPSTSREISFFLITFDKSILLSWNFATRWALWYSW